MSIEPQPFPSPKQNRGGYIAAIAMLLVIVVLLGAFLSAMFVANGFTLFRRTPPQIIPPPASSIVDPGTGNVPPTIKLWNSCGSTMACVMNASGWREGGVPDTFDYYVTFTSTVPVTVYFLTLAQYTQFAYCNGQISCVSGFYKSDAPTMSAQNLIFKLAEGCADYVAIYKSSANGTMSPNIMIGQNPAQFPTGICAVSG